MKSAPESLSPSVELSLIHHLSGLEFVPQQQQYTAQIVVAQSYMEQDILSEIQKGWNGFVESGQIWAMLIGIVIGYLLKSITSSH